MSTIARQYARLTAEKRDLFIKLLQAQGIDPLSLILPVDRVGGNGHCAFPLSYAQERMWFHYQLDPSSPYYNIPSIYRMSGRLDLPRLSQCLSQIISRHEALRTIFAIQEGDPAQVILPDIPLPLQFFDLTGLEPELRETEARRRIEEETLCPFDLTRGPLLRVVLWRLQPDEHIVAVNFHHIIADGWSMNVFIDELMALYSLPASAPNVLPDMDLQYVDYASWQKHYLQGETLQQLLAYWTDKLAGCPPMLELPTDHPRPPAQSFRGGYLSFELAPELVQQLQALAHQENVSLFMLLLAIFQLLLARYSGQTDVCVGTPIANRDRVELENLIGFFVNTLVLRSDLSGELSFHDLLDQVRTVCLDGYAHQSMPFEQIVEAVQPERSMSHSPIFQVMFSLENAPRQAQELPWLTIAPVDIHSGTTKFDLSLIMHAEDNRISGGFEYSTDLFDTETIQRMIGHFQTLLKAAAADPNQSIHTLPILTQDEYQQILVDWNHTVHSFFSGCAHHLFEGWASSQPEAAALIYESEMLTYGQLNRRANVLAHQLHAQGVGPDMPVGIFCQRGFDLITAILAVLKAGGAYVPLDPAYPSDRLAYILSDSAATVFITHPPLLNQIPEHHAQVISLDHDRLDQEAASEHLECDFPCPAGPENLAYIIYTSGSTGKPKGVLLHHRGLCNQIEYMRDAFQITPGTRSLQFASISFDASVWDIFMALANGGTLVLAPSEIIATGSSLAHYMEEKAVNVATIMPSMMGELPPIALPDLRVMIAGAETCPSELVQTWGRGRTFFNVYGPTETTIVSTTALCDADDPLPPTIGRPIHNTSIYILDAHGKPLPVGIPGEMYIGGVGVARGYLNRPELTAERFLPDPFSPTPGARMYKTGDRVRWLANGNLEFLGRLDNQVKVRGFRIELGEIETALLDHPAVQQAVVLLRDIPTFTGSQASQRLVAYLVLHPSSNELTESALRAHLKTRLPEYMIPSAFVRLEKMPLTTNAKINRKALPEPENAITLSSNDESETSKPIQTSPVEEITAGIWKQLTGAQNINSTSNFFEIGGHSLMAARAITRVNNVFQVNVPLRTLFEFPLLHSFTQEVEKAIQSSSNSSLPSIAHIEKSDPIPLSFPQQRLWFLDKLDPEGSLYNIPLALRLLGSLDPSALQKSLDLTIQRHEALRTVFGEKEGIAYQSILPALTVTMDVVNLDELAEDQREVAIQQRILSEARHSFDLSAAPLLRAVLLRVSADDHIVVFVIHHIISDGWSMSVLANELMVFYNSLVQPAENITAEPLLPELSIQYGDYAVWQREWLQGQELEEQMGYWKQQLAELPPQLDLPTDFPRPALQTNHGATLAFPIDPALAAEIKHFAQQEGATLFMTLLAAFQSLLYRTTQQDDFAVGTPIANRSRAELENLIGFFINTLVLRADLSGEPSFRQLLARVRETCLGAYAHQDLPFEAIVDALQPDRNLNRTPLFQVMFILQNNPLPVQSFQGLQTEWIDVNPGTSMFDMTLVLQETSDGLSAGFEYNTDLYEPERIARMAEHFTLLLGAALSQPDLPISRLPMLSAQERQAVLFAFNDTARLDPRLALPIPTLFEQQVERCPDALALLAPADGASLSYTQLNTLANQLAHALLRMQLPPDAVVAVCLDRSPAAIACLLACLKTGLTFLPLDPSMPPQRLRFLLDDAQAALLITRPDTHLHLAPLPFPVLFIPHNDPWPWQALPVHNPALPLPADTLAYLLYTSGSTGQPKGVLVEQRALLNHNLAAARLFDLQPADRLLQFASLAFDTALEEILPTLLHGATLVLRPDNLLPDAQLLIEWIAGWQLSVLDLPTAYWHAWVAALQQHPQPLPACLRLVVVGGEAAHPQALAAFQRLAGTRVTFLNTYGPTEAAIIATAYQPPCPFQLPALPIGRPIDNARVYLLDAHHQPVPIGCPGELYIAGAGVARGYLHRPELTDQRFLPDPFCPGQRMYQTGDRACWRSDGQLLFLGRLDNQLKLRGFRVEPGEIESWLSSHPLVAEAAVLPWQAPNGATLLVAYLVTAPQQPAPSLATLRDFLAQHLPDFMLPAALVCLPALPHTTTGKLDRAALPPPVFDAPSSTAPLPLTPVEQRLAQLWAELLARPGVSREDNFFALGGDSILSLQLVARAAQAGLHLTPRMLFEHPRLADLAAQLADAPLAPAIPQQPDSGAYPLTPIQQWFFRLNLAHPQHWNQSLLLALPQPPDPAHLQRILQALIDHHDLLRCAFTPDAGGAWTALVLPPGLPMPALDFVDLAQRPAEQQDAAMTAACSQLQAGFHLDRPPLLAARLFWLGAARGARLLLVAHHLVVDGISWRILLDDLRLALHQPAAQPILFPPRTVAFRAWAEALPALARSETLLAELPFWRSLPASAPLPCDGRPQHNQERAAQTRSLHLDGAATQTLLLHSAPALHATLEQLLLGALGWGLRQWAGPRAYTIELEHHGRSSLPALDVSRTVGWFTAAFPLGLELSAVADPLEALRQVKSSLHRLPNQGFGFGLLAAFHPDPLLRQQLWSLANPPISFNFLGQLGDSAPMDGVAMASEDRGPETDPGDAHSAQLDVSGGVMDGVLRMEFTYSPDLHSEQSIQRLMDAFSTALQVYLHPEDNQAATQVLTNTDFPLANLNQKDFKRVMGKISQKHGKVA